MTDWDEIQKKIAEKKKNREFLCTECGACCHIAGGLFFPKRDDGACINLGKDEKCIIYEKRPELCKVKGKFRETTEFCHTLIDLYGLDERYKVDLSEYDDYEKEEE